MRERNPRYRLYYRTVGWQVGVYPIERRWGRSAGKRTMAMVSLNGSGGGLFMNISTSERFFSFPLPFSDRKKLYTRPGRPKIFLYILNTFKAIIFPPGCLHHFFSLSAPYSSTREPSFPRFDLPLDQIWPIKTLNALKRRRIKFPEKDG